LQKQIVKPARLSPIATGDVCWCFGEDLSQTGSVCRRRTGALSEGSEPHFLARADPAASFGSGCELDRAAVAVRADGHFCGCTNMEGDKNHLEQR